MASGSDRSGSGEADALTTDAFGTRFDTVAPTPPKEPLSGRQAPEEAGQSLGGVPRYDPERYSRLELLGRGGMGEVWRVHDRALARNLALKTMRRDIAATGETRARFLFEARVTALIQHPGVLPIYELGQEDDDSPYYTMKEQSGTTLRSIIFRERALGAPGLRRLVEWLNQACEAVAFSHAAGIVHRDLKPDNVMVGEYAEVVVVDWGLAHALPAAALHLRAGERPARAVGTPEYMAPEQLDGRDSEVGPWTDVFALGGILYEILSGTAPFPRGPASAMARATSTPEPLTHDAGPTELVALCARAMELEPSQRLPDAEALAAGLSAWLSGEAARDRARALVLEAASYGEQLRALQTRSVTLRSEASDLLGQLGKWAAPVLKEPAWSLEDEADRMERRSEELEALILRDLRAALSHAPDLPEAHDALADYHRQAHQLAEQAGSRAEARKHEELLRAHGRDRYATYLAGTGAVTLLTDPPGAEVTLFRYVPRRRRQVPELVEVLGRTPLVERSLPMGSYLLVVRHPEREEVRYPVQVGRSEHWHGVPPGAERPLPVPLPTVGSLGPNDLYIPPGWYRSGGDAQSIDDLPGRRLWVDACVVRRFPVTMREYLAYLDALVAEGREGEALDHALRQPGDRNRHPDPPLLERTPTGGFTLPHWEEGRNLLPDHPALYLRWTDARAYAAWHAEQTGQPWRLIDELEWEKAARGVDGRIFPWGDFQEPTWSRTADAEPGRGMPVPVDSYPVDESPYGMRGAAGNATEFTGTPFTPKGASVRGERCVPTSDDGSETFYVRRGGVWISAAITSRLGMRWKTGTTDADALRSFRLSRTF